jgi:branched-chain amino acid transport system substrate-binding protein
VGKLARQVRSSRSLFSGAQAGQSLPRHALNGFDGGAKNKKFVLGRKAMSCCNALSCRVVRTGGGLAAAVLAIGLVAAPAWAESDAPITVGFAMSVTGPLAPNGKQALAGAKIWEEETNAKGGLLGRKVKLITYEDQSNPANVPGIYTKLLDVDKVDLVVSGYATNMVAPAMPVVMQKGKTFIGLFALDVNSEFHYPKYFSMLPTGPDTKASFTDGFFQVAVQQNPKPTTVALASEDAEFARNACTGARENAKRFGIDIVYDKSFPPGTTDFSPIIRALQAANADLVIVCSYPLSSVGIVQSANELSFTPKMFGGAMVGLQATVFKDRLKSKMNGIVNYETWVPSEKLMAPRPKASTRSAIISAAGAMPTFRFLVRPSRAPTASMTTSSPTICAPTNSRPSLAT